MYYLSFLDCSRMRDELGREMCFDASLSVMACLGSQWQVRIDRRNDLSYDHDLKE